MEKREIMNAIKSTACKACKFLFVVPDSEHCDRCNQARAACQAALTEAIQKYESLYDVVFRRTDEIWIKIPDSCEEVYIGTEYAKLSHIQRIADPSAEDEILIESGEIEIIEDYTDRRTTTILPPPMSGEEEPETLRRLPLMVDDETDIPVTSGYRSTLPVPYSR